MRDTAERGADWVSAHAFYHEDLDRLIVELVGPMVAELAAAGLARQWFFLRYWDGGPHVRLRVLPSEDSARSEVEDMLGDRFAEYFAAKPAAQRVGQPEYAELAESLARWEGLSTFAPELHPNNSMSLLPYRREHDRYGYGDSVRLVERHFAESSRIALDVLRAGSSLERRATAATALILLTWFGAQPDPSALREWISEQGRDSADFVPGEAGFEHSADPARVLTLAEQMRALAARVDEVTSSGTFADWCRTTNALRVGLAEQVSTGAFTPPARGWEGPGGIATADPDGAVLVVLDICAHLVCNRLGVPPVVEGVLRRTAADAVDALAKRR